MAAVLSPLQADAPDTVEGIDVGTSQASLNFASAAAAGIGFVVVKVGGSQLSTCPYVNPHYAAQVDAARAAGMRVGHYWVSGDFQTPAVAADYFVAHLHRYHAGDVLALDDEVLNDSHTLWNDSKVAAFLTEVKARLGTVVPCSTSVPHRCERAVGRRPLRPEPSSGWLRTAAVPARIPDHPASGAPIRPGRHTSTPPTRRWAASAVSTATAR